MNSFCVYIYLFNLVFIQSSGIYIKTRMRYCCRQCNIHKYEDLPTLINLQTRWIKCILFLRFIYDSHQTADLSSQIKKSDHVQYIFLMSIHWLLLFVSVLDEKFNDPARSNVQTFTNSNKPNRKWKSAICPKAEDKKPVFRFDRRWSERFREIFFWVGWRSIFILCCVSFRLRLVLLLIIWRASKEIEKRSLAIATPYTDSSIRFIFDSLKSRLIANGLKNLSNSKLLYLFCFGYKKDESQQNNNQNERNGTFFLFTLLLRFSLRFCFCFFLFLFNFILRRQCRSHHNNMMLYIHGMSSPHSHVNHQPSFHFFLNLRFDEYSSHHSPFVCNATFASLLVYSLFFSYNFNLLVLFAARFVYICRRRQKNDPSSTLSFHFIIFFNIFLDNQNQSLCAPNPNLNPQNHNNTINAHVCMNSKFIHLMSYKIIVVIVSCNRWSTDDDDDDRGSNELDSLWLNWWRSMKIGRAKIEGTKYGNRNTRVFFISTAVIEIQSGTIDCVNNGLLYLTINCALLYTGYDETTTNILGVWSMDLRWPSQANQLLRFDSS